MKHTRIVGTMVAQKPSAGGESMTSRVVPVEGEFDLEQKSSGTTYIDVDVGSGSGIRAFMNMLGHKANIRVNQGQRACWVKSDRCLEKFRGVASDKDNLVQITNYKTGNQVRIRTEQDMILMEPDSFVKIRRPVDEGIQMISFLVEILDDCLTNMKFVFRYEIKLEETPLPPTQYGVVPTPTPTPFPILTPTPAPLPPSPPPPPPPPPPGPPIYPSGSPIFP